MDFSLRHRFPHPADVVWEAIHTDDYDRDAQEVSDLDREVLADEVQGGTRVRRTMVTSRKKLPGFVAKLIGSEHLSYELIERYPPGKRLMEWTVIPKAVADKVQATGTFEIVEAAGGCERLVKGRIKVSVPIIGSKIEKAIGEELKASYDKTASFALGWLKERLG